VLSTYPASTHRSGTRSFPAVIAEVGHSMQVVAGADGVVVELDDTMRSGMSIVLSGTGTGISAGWPPHRGQTRPSLSRLVQGCE